MTKTKKRPSVKSARDAAKAMTAALKLAGFIMSDTRKYSGWGEGAYAKSMGSMTVYVGYNIASWNAEDDAKRRVLEQEICAFLTAIGYDVHPDGFVVCKSH